MGPKKYDALTTEIQAENEVELVDEQTIYK
jgi:hypothetical protein